jgi:hypothetical protein
MTNCAWSVAAANTSSLQAHQRLSTANHIPIDQSGHFSLSSLASDTTAQGNECFSTRRASSALDQSRSPPILEDYLVSGTCTVSAESNLALGLGEPAATGCGHRPQAEFSHCLKLPASQKKHYLALKQKQRRHAPAAAACSG